MQNKPNIFLTVPRADKTRWVRNANGATLNERVAELIRRGETMDAIPIAQTTLNTQYHGVGWAIVAVVDGWVVAIKYLDDLDDALSDTLDEYAEAGLMPKAMITSWLETPAAGVHIRELQAIGNVSVGMCSCSEFVEM